MGTPREGASGPPFLFLGECGRGGECDFSGQWSLTSNTSDVQRSPISNSQREKRGKLAFLTLQHDIRRDSKSYVVEEQDIVYRNPSAASSQIKAQKSGDKAKSFDHLRTVSTTPITLFRFSALTYNSHRIHYDETFARDEEGYEERLVHGPLMAIMLMDHYRRNASEKRVREFAFRAKQPVFVNTNFDLCLTLTTNGGNLSLHCGERGVAMEASVIAE